MCKRLFVLALLCLFLGGCAHEKKTGTAPTEISEKEKQIEEWIDYAIQQESIDLDSAAHYYQKAGRLADSIRSYEGKVRYIYNYTSVLNQWGRFEESEALIREALKLAQAKNDTLNIAKGFNNIAVIYNYRSLYDTAYVNYLQAVTYFQKTNFHKIYVIYSNLGAVLSDMGRLDEAISYYDKALPLAQNAGDSLYMLIVLSNIGVATGLKGEDTASLHFYLKALPYTKNYPQSLFTTQLYGNLGHAYIVLDQLDSAEFFYQKYYDLSLKQGNESNIGSALHGFSIIHFDKKNYKAANTYSIEALKYLDEEQSISTMRLYKNMVHIKHYLKMHDSSYAYFMKYSDLRDTIQQNEIQETISQAEKKFQLAQKEEELLSKELQLTKSKLEHRKKNGYLAIGVLLVITLGTITYLLSRNIKQRDKLFVAERDNLQKEKEMSILRASLEGAATERFRIAKELHDDLGSGLTGIRFLAEKMAHQDKDGQTESLRKIQESTKSLTEQMSEIIWSMDSDSNTLEELLAFIRMKIATLLGENEIDYRFSFPAQVPELRLSGFFRRNVYLLVKEAVHNAIKHSGTDRMDITIALGEGLDMTIADYGHGIKESQKGRTGHGFRNMEQRVRALSGTWTIGAENGTVLRFHIPYPAED